MTAFLFVFIKSNTEIIERSFMIYTVGIFHLLTEIRVSIASIEETLLRCKPFKFIFSNSAREETINTYNTKLETSIN